MVFNPIFSNQVRLIVSALPQVSKEKCFALKGGTAINLFVCDMPRLSVDIDLAYIPVEIRDISLINIDSALRRIGQNVTRYLPGTRATYNTMHNSSLCNRILIDGNNAKIKIEVSPVLRGSIHPPILTRVSPSVEDYYGSTEMRVLHFSDLYAGKICAALDRQHPRDLFDIIYLLKNEKMSADLKNCFLAYLLSHNRPMAELLDPSHLDIKELYENEFVGMTREPISIEELYQTRDELVSEIHKILTDNDKNFLVSLKLGKPDWSLFAYPHAQHLPAIQWKIYNISQMSEEKKSIAHKKLEQILFSGPVRSNQ